MFKVVQLAHLPDLHPVALAESCPEAASLPLPCPSSVCPTVSLMLFSVHCLCHDALSPICSFSGSQREYILVLSVLCLALTVATGKSS